MVDAARSVKGAVAALQQPAAVVLIDGRSGAGKSTLARLLVECEPQPSPAQVVALDDIYPGWDGLDAGVTYAREHVIDPYARGEVARWRRWDWERDCRGERREVDPDKLLIIEGSGIITKQTMRFASVAVWLDAPDSARKQRALARDGDTYSPYWLRWAAQEEVHIVRDHPAARATLKFALP